MNSTILSLLLFGVFLNAAAQLFLKAGMNRIGHFNFTLHNVLPIGLKVATNPCIIMGLLSYVISVIVWMLVLSRIPVGLAYPMVSIGYIVTAIMAYFLFQEDLSVTQIIGILVIIGGVYLITRS
jgi:multidrug transporter EmrE-like cation transporter